MLLLLIKYTEMSLKNKYNNSNHNTRDILRKFHSNRSKYNWHVHQSWPFCAENQKRWQMHCPILYIWGNGSVCFRIFSPRQSAFEYTDGEAIAPVGGWLGYLGVAAKAAARADSSHCRGIWFGMNARWCVSNSNMNLKIFTAWGLELNFIRVTQKRNGVNNLLLTLQRNKNTRT